MATIKKAQAGITAKKKTFKSNPDSGGVSTFTVSEQKERRKKLGLPTSKKEEKSYYDKMSKEGAKNGKSVKKYQMGGFVSNEFAAKSISKPKAKSRIIDSPIKTSRGKDINAFQGKKGMLAKDGKSFPDLNKDGKVTRADILKGRGVIAKKGASVKKCKYGCK